MEFHQGVEMSKRKTYEEWLSDTYGVVRIKNRKKTKHIKNESLPDEKDSSTWKKYRKNQYK